MNFWWMQLVCILPYAAGGFMFTKFLAPSKCKAEEHAAWSYKGSNGPHHWGHDYPFCNGQEQSPIAIMSQYAVPKDTLPKLAMRNYDIPLTKAAIENNGHTIQVTPADGVQRTININGDTYNLAQFHFHWGDSYNCGAEHTINGVQYSMELHFVHMNSKNEIAVVGVFFQEQDMKSEGLENIVAQLPDVMYNETRTQLYYSVDLNKLLPANPSSYFRYRGSLTTPDCAEGVTWSVLTAPLPVGKDQMTAFRKLFSVKKSDASKNCKLSNNYRPVQPLNERTVFISQ